jgi:hypothetical protein
MRALRDTFVVAPVANGAARTCRAVETLTTPQFTVSETTVSIVTRIVSSPTARAARLDTERERTRCSKRAHARFGD